MTGDAAILPHQGLAVVAQHADGRPGGSVAERETELLWLTREVGLGRG